MAVKIPHTTVTLTVTGVISVFYKKAVDVRSMHRVLVQRHDTNHLVVGFENISYKHHTVQRPISRSKRLLSK